MLVLVSSICFISLFSGKSYPDAYEADNTSLHDADMRRLQYGIFYQIALKHLDVIMDN